MRVVPLDFSFSDSGSLSIEARFDIGWRRANSKEINWRFHARDRSEVLGQQLAIGVTLTSVPADSFFNPVNPSPLSVHPRLPEADEDEPPRFARYRGEGHGLSYSIDNSHCLVRVDIRDDGGGFNQSLPWRRTDAKATFEFSCDLWAEQLRSTAEAIKRSTRPRKPRSYALVKSNLVPATTAPAVAIRCRSFRLMVTIDVYAPARAPSASSEYVNWWERTFPGLRVVSGGRPESNRRKF